MFVYDKNHRIIGVRLLNGNIRLLVWWCEECV